MAKHNLFLKGLVLSLTVVFSLNITAYAEIRLEFVGNEAETEAVFEIENLLEEDRKEHLEAVLSDVSANKRFNAAKMLADIGDGITKSKLITRILSETDEEAREEQIRAMYLIDFKLVVLSGKDPAGVLLNYFYSDYYPLREGICKNEPNYDNTIEFLYILANMRSEAIRTIINNILNLSKAEDLGLLPETCQDILYRLNTLKNYPEPRYVYILRNGGLPLRYWAASKLALKPKTQVLTPDNKTVVDILKEQLTYAAWNGYESYLNYIKSILINKFAETIEEVSPLTYENQPPTIPPIANQTVYVGGSLNLTLTAQDPDAALPAIIYFKSLNPLPQGASITGNKLIWSPTSNQTGTYEITLYAQDEAGEISSYITFKIYVQGRGGYYGGGYYGGGYYGGGYY